MARSGLVRLRGFFIGSPAPMSLVVSTLRSLDVPARDDSCCSRTHDPLYKGRVKTVAAAKFKEQCLAWLDRVGPEGIVITKHGKPVGRLVPIGREPKALIGSLKGKIRVHGNIQSTGVAATSVVHGIPLLTR